MKLSVAYEFLPKQPSSHASVVMDHFGIGFETGRNVIAEDLELPIEKGDVVCFTGASGSGKSSLMRAVAEQIGGIEDYRLGVADSTNPKSAIRNSPRVLNIDTLDLGNRILVDSFNLPVKESLQLLSMCGLGEAQLLLRTPQELSDGQRYRFRRCGLAETLHTLLFQHETRFWHFLEMSQYAVKWHPAGVSDTC
jgi:ABC-type ATPase with predicted acetyltransferase domain